MLAARPAIEVAENRKSVELSESVQKNLSDVDGSLKKRQKITGGKWQSAIAQRMIPSIRRHIYKRQSHRLHLRTPRNFK